MIRGVSASAIRPGGEESQALYARALRSGLQFGPAYWQLARAVRVDASTIEVELTEQTGDARFGLDPARLDLLLPWTDSSFRGEQRRRGRVSADAF